MAICTFLYFIGYNLLILIKFVHSEELCKENELYIKALQSCILCSDICHGKIVNNNFCLNYCQDQLSLSQSQSIIKELINQPLFWVSILLLFISICSTIIIIVLCVKHSKILMNTNRTRRTLNFNRSRSNNQIDIDINVKKEFKRNNSDTDNSNCNLIHCESIQSDQLLSKQMHSNEEPVISIPISNQQIESIELKSLHDEIDYPTPINNNIYPIINKLITIITNRLAYEGIET